MVAANAAGYPRDSVPPPSVVADEGAIKKPKGVKTIANLVNHVVQVSRLDRLTGTRIGVGALYVFAASAWVSTALANIALSVCLLAFLAQIPSEWPRLRREPMCILVAVAGVYLLGNTLWAMYQQPHLASKQPGAALSWFSLWLFMVIAWWCAGDKHRIRAVLSLALASFIVSLLLAFDWPQWHAILIEGYRSGIGFTAAAAGLYAATALLGWLLLATPWNLDLKSRVTLSLAFTAWIAVIVLLIQVIIISQSRTTWLALILVGIPLAVLAAKATRKKITLRRSVVAGITVLGLLGIVYSNSEVIRSRLSLAHTPLEQMLELDWSHIPYSSVGVRLHLDQYGLEKLIERPLLGWGPGTVVTQFAAAAGFPQLVKQPDLHNSFLLMLVRLGLIGGLIYLAGAAYLSRRVWRAYRNNRMSQRMFLFLLGAAGITILASLMNFRWIHIDFRFFWLILAGVAFSYALEEPKTAHNRTPVSDSG